MSNAMVKVGPLAGFLAAVAYCVWPLVRPPATAVSPPALMPEIEDAWLRPAFGPPAPRDPFRPPGAPPPSAAAASRATAAGPGGPKAGGASARAPARRAADPGPPPPFRLGGTLVAGGRRLAIIDGRVYRQGEPIEAGDMAAPGWRVERVEAGRVLISRPRRGDPVALEFRDPLAAMAEAPAAGPARPAGPGPEPGGLDVRSAMAAAGIPMPGPSILEHLANQSGGSVPGAYRALLNLLISPPQLPGGTGTDRGGTR